MLLMINTISYFKCLHKIVCDRNTVVFGMNDSGTTMLQLL